MRTAKRRVSARIPTNQGNRAGGTGIAGKSAHVAFGCGCAGREHEAGAPASSIGLVADHALGVAPANGGAFLSHRRDISGGSEDLA